MQGYQYPCVDHRTDAPWWRLVLVPRPPWPVPGLLAGRPTTSL